MVSTIPPVATGRVYSVAASYRYHNICNPLQTGKQTARCCADASASWPLDIATACASRRLACVMAAGTRSLGTVELSRSAPAEFKQSQANLNGNGDVCNAGSLTDTPGSCSSTASSCSRRHSPIKPSPPPPPPSPPATIPSPPPNIVVHKFSPYPKKIPKKNGLVLSACTGN